MILPTLETANDENVPPPSHAANNLDCLFFLLHLEQLPPTAQRIVVRQASLTGNGDEASIGGDDSVADRVLRSDVGRRDLQAKKVRPHELCRRGAERRTLMCCQTSDSGLMTLMSG